MPRINLDDFIDPDEGRELIRQAFYTHAEPCENCGTPCLDGRVWVPGYDYFGCSSCAEEAEALIFAETNCPTLHDAIVRSRRVSEVRAALREHKESCPNCNPALRKRADVAEMPAPATPRKEAA